LSRRWGSGLLRRTLHDSQSRGNHSSELLFDLGGKQRESLRLRTDISFIGTVRPPLRVTSPPSNYVRLLLSHTRVSPSSMMRFAIGSFEGGVVVIYIRTKKGRKIRPLRLGVRAGGERGRTFLASVSR
jgi:hypothetical protein